MRIAQAFDPIEVGETDNFVFDFTNEMGSAFIVSTSWTCGLAPYQTITDPNPQSHIMAAQPLAAVQVRSSLDPSQLITKTGSFSVALIGGFTISQASGTYVLEATANLSDGRTLKLNSTVIVKSTGS